MLQSPLKKLKIGQGIPGGAGTLRRPQAAGLPPVPQTPHIHGVPNPPPINYGAVAQQGHRPQQQSPGLLTGLSNAFKPIASVGPALGKTVTPKALKLSGSEKQALKAIKHPDTWQNAKPEVKARVLNPTPRMQLHIDSNPQLKGNHLFIQHQFTRMNPSEGIVSGAELQKQETQKAKIAAEKPIEAGILPIQHLGGVGGFAQNLLTETGQTAIGVGPGLYHLGGGLIHDPVGTTSTMVQQFGHSMGQTIHHPLRQLNEDPLGLITNVLIPLSVTAGSAARIAEFSKTAEALRTGEITKLQAVSRIGKTLMRPQRMQRSIQVAPGVRVEPPAFKGALGGYLQTKVLDPLTERAIQSGKFQGATKKFVALGREFKAPGAIEGMTPAGKAGKLLRRDQEMERTIRQGMEEERMRRFMGPQSEPTTTLYHGGPKGLEGGALTTTKGRIRDFFGGNGLYATTSHHVANAYSKFHGEPTIHELTVAKRAIADAEKPITPEIRKAIEPVTGPLMKNDTLRSVFERLDKQPGKGVEDLVKPIAKVERVDPRAVQEALSNIGIHGISYKPLTSASHIRNIFDALGHSGVPFGASEANDAIKGLGGSREHLIWNLPEAQKIEKTAGLPASEAQRIATGRGNARAHLDLWHSLYHGGAGYDESFLHNPEGYTAIRKPPDQLKMKAYANEAGLHREFQRMIERDPAKIHADPDAYSFIPNGTIRRLMPHEPGKGTIARVFDTIDRGTQMIRIGRFLHPGYIAWAAQNGILHLSQAGMFAFRNAYQLRHEYSRLTPMEKAVFDNSVGAGHFGGGIARATEGSGKFAKLSHKLAGFWHNIDDRPFRLMSMIHELNHAGYHSAEDWAKLMRDNPKRFRTIARGAQQQAIDYSEMSPAERATLQKVFTAWGWTRGASTYTMRFPFEHPIQGAALENIGQEGKKHVEDFYAGHNGMVPNWLRGYLPIGHGNHPFLLDSSLLNPGETFGNVLGEIPGLEKGQTEKLSQEEAPVPAAIQELVTGTDRYGNALKPGTQVTQPISDLLHRFEPFGALSTMLTSKHGGGTLKQGPLEGLARFGSIPISQLNDADKTAALGEKDYEQSLTKPDQINFRYANSVAKLSKEAALARSHGINVSPGMIGKLKGDLEAVHTRDMFQYHFAQSHGANTYRSLPAINKVQAAIEFGVQNHYWTPAQARSYTALAATLKDDTQLNGLATELWGDTGIGAMANEWKSAIKDLAPNKLTPGRG